MPEVDENVEAPGVVEDGPKKKPSEMSDQEYAAEMAKSVKPPPSPVHPFWESVKSVMSKQRDPKDIARSVGRGVLSAITETGDTIAQGAAAFDRKTGLGEALTPGFNAAYDEPGAGSRGMGEGTFTKNAQGTNVADALLGKRSDDGLASFAEGAAQFTAAFEMTGGLKYAKGLAGVIARGAVVDASAFNPYEAQLAELAASAPQSVKPVLHQLMATVQQTGKALSVSQDDSEIVARLKRAAAGGISGLAIESFIAGARLVRGGKVLAEAGATPAEKELARTQVTESAAKLQDINAGTAVPEGSHVVVKDAPGGEGFTIEPTHDGELEKMVRPLPDETARTQPVTMMQPPTELDQHVPSPVFPSRAEAETQAATMNGAIQARIQVGEPDEAAVQRLLSAAEDPEKFAAVQADPELNISYHNTPEQDMAIVGDISQRLADKIRATVYKEGQLSVPAALQMAQDSIREIPEDAAHPVMKALLKSNPENQSVVSLMADMVLKDKGKKIVQLSDVYESRPHDPVALQEMTTAINNYMDLRHTMYETTAEQGRALRFKQEREAAQALDVNYRDDGVSALPSPKAPVDVVEPAKSAVKKVQEAVDAIKQSKGGSAVKDGEAGADTAGKNTTDTISVTAADFSLARARKQVEAALKKIEDGDKSFTHDPALAVERAKGIKESADAQRADPIALSPDEAAAAKEVKTGTVNPMEQLSRILDDAERTLDKALEDAKLPPRPKAKGQTTPIQDRFAEVRRQSQEEPQKMRKGSSVDASGVEQGGSSVELQSRAVVADGEVQLQDLLDEADSIFKDLQGDREVSADALSAVGPAAKKPARIGKTSAQDTPEIRDVAGMKARDASRSAVDEQNAAAVARMFKMADGEPRNANAIIRGTQVLKQGGTARAALEVFVNFLLSGPKTWATVLSSGATMSTFEPIIRMGAGLKTGNASLFVEGADLMYGNFRYMVDNMASAAAAFREGRSITNPMPQQIAIGGATGELVRLPSDVLTAMHEFTTVTNYRSFIRAKSLRMGRAQGLSGDALATRVDQDLRAAFDPETGIATVPEGLKYAQNATFTTPLAKGSFSAGFQDFTNNHIEAKFIAPFVKISSNIFNYTWKATPFLNRFNAAAKETLAAGGEAADVLKARTAIMGGIYATGMYQAFAGNLTGAGPADPQLKSLWLADHQPYSIKVDGQWLSYRRVEPFATTLGLMADLHTMIQELDEKNPDAENFAYATVAALSSNFASKTYMQGLTDFMGTWGGGNPTKMKQYLQKMGAGLIVPNLVAQGNPDDTMREVNTMREAIMARVPGWSQTLDPRFNIMGEPIMKDPNFMRRTLSPVAVRGVTNGVENDLMQLGKGMPAFPQKLLQGRIDLSDRTAYDNGTGVSPYARFNAILSHPKSGESMRDALTTLVKSDKYQNASGTVEGVELGGKRALYAAGVKTEHEQKAFAQLRQEYPKLDDAWKNAQRESGAALKGGSSGLDAFRALRAMP